MEKLDDIVKYERVGTIEKRHKNVIYKIDILTSNVGETYYRTEMGIIYKMTYKGGNENGKRRSN